MAVSTHENSTELLTLYPSCSGYRSRSQRQLDNTKLLFFCQNCLQVVVSVTMYAYLNLLTDFAISLRNSSSGPDNQTEIPLLSHTTTMSYMSVEIEAFTTLFIRNKS